MSVDARRAGGWGCGFWRFVQCISMALTGQVYKVHKTVIASQKVKIGLPSDLAVSLPGM